MTSKRALVPLTLLLVLLATAIIATLAIHSEWYDVEPGQQTIPLEWIRKLLDRGGTITITDTPLFPPGGPKGDPCMKLGKATRSWHDEFEGLSKPARIVIDEGWGKTFIRSTSEGVHLATGGSLGFRYVYLPYKTFWKYAAGWRGLTVPITASNIIAAAERNNLPVERLQLEELINRMGWGQDCAP